jgi:hypothetical protein
VTNQLSNTDRGEQWSEQELDFMRRWRQLVDRAGGQSAVARKLNWATSTVSRDYNGDTLPRKERLVQLCHFLEMPRQEAVELLGLLEKAHAARRARPRGKTARPVRQHVAPSAGRSWPRIPAWAAVAAVAAVALAVIIWSLPEGSAPPPAAAPQSPVTPQPGPKPTGGPYPGLKLKAVAIPLATLQGPLKDAFSKGRLANDGTVTGYEFRNSGDTGLCLGAMTAGTRAGKVRDPVRVWNCSLAASQIWIPEQWELQGSRFTWLVNYQYQSKCLNADNIGGLSKNHVVQLWDCYRSDNEEWDFGDWYSGLKSGASSYPIFVQFSNLCLDADKFDLRDGTTVHIWDQYPTASQFWS